MPRFDERGQHPTPGSDAVRDGRQLMVQEDGDYLGTTVPADERAAVAFVERALSPLLFERALVFLHSTEPA